ncbi:DNA topoisomerase IV subunit A [Clostridium hydrogeniformans]|uniref:DNA topoisomerase IV subunit A n=1 Tax=Clostridium hydrogeniformans TaxID=349933 RepID=UPI0004877BB1|nr:DNA topoisomerase IV subunit A [Clostridium hydrogeniformans]
MAKKDTIIPKDNNIIEVPMEEVMPENYLPYAIEVAKERALPDVRDGLKPVHRRILYGAYLLKAFPDKPYFKSARIVGDILGKFHPHGDASVYDSMVIMAQNFSTRAPLIDGHGNWGSIDGDSAAAMRYTEARLTNIALELLKDIDKNVVDMVPNYSNTEEEPKVLPARYPNLLVNGTFGIAVGLATNIPPHNLGEVIDGTLAYIDNKDITTKDLMEYVKGPDLPTGGILIGSDSLRAAYETGEGRVTLRAKTSIEKLENGRLGIVITEFPYRKNKARLLQTISEMTGDKRHAKALESITDIRDESDREGIRAVIEFKKAVDEDMADKVLKYLFKKTDLQCNISFNMVALAEGKPETMGLKTILTHYVNHQKEVITRRSERELEIAEKRFHIVEGFIKAIEVLDEVIKIIRGSKSKKDARENLIKEFSFTELQADAILELMLYRLTGLEIKVFEKEYKELEKIIKGLKKILSSEKELLKVIKDELLRVKEEYGDSRRSKIIEDESEAKIDLEELIVVEDTMITLSNDGFIKRVGLKYYNRLNLDLKDIDYREGDFGKYLIPSNTKDTFVVFTNKGNMYQLKGNMIPEYKWKEKGERLDELIRGLDLNEESIISAFSFNIFSSSKVLVFINSKGGIKKTSLDNFLSSYSKLSALKLKEGENLVEVYLRELEEEEKCLRIKTFKGLDFTVSEPELSASPRNNIGIYMFTLNGEDYIVETEVVVEYPMAEFTFGINTKGDIKIYDRGRADAFNKARVNSFKDILIFTKEGKVYKIPGFMVQNLRDVKINIRDLVDDMSEEDSVVSVISINDYSEDLGLYTFTAGGYIKKMGVTELQGEISGQSYHKLKENDYVIGANLGNINEGTALIISKDGMGIKFPVDSINDMSRNAQGVIGISLKDEDEAIFGYVISSEDNEIAVTSKDIGLTINTENGIEKHVDISSIKVQNRAGRGNTIVPMKIEDRVSKIKLS